MVFGDRDGGSNDDCGGATTNVQTGHRWAIVLHGGAGVIERAKLGPDGDSGYRAGLKAGY